MVFEAIVLLGICHTSVDNHSQCPRRSDNQASIARTLQHEIRAFGAMTRLINDRARHEDFPRASVLNSSVKQHPNTAVGKRGVEARGELPPFIAI